MGDNTRTMEIDEVGRIVLYEITIQVRALQVRMLFNAPPTIGRICECISAIFSDNHDVELGLVTLLLSLGDDKDQQSTIFEVGDEIRFTEDEEYIGFIHLQSRTLFDV